MQKKNRIKLISLNIELDRHLDSVIPFLQSECPDIACLQEVREKDTPALEAALGMESRFVAICISDTRLADDGSLVVDEELMREGPEGITLFTALPVRASRTDYYRGEKDRVPCWSEGPRGVLLSATFEKMGVSYTVGTTHFTWTPDGEADEAQRRDARALLELLAQFPDLALCGDFNAPRGREIWRMFASRYSDNIPSEYQSSLDPALHRAGHLQRMVDGLFTSPHYRARHVRLQCGLSDHCAVVAEVARVS